LAPADPIEVDPDTPADVLERIPPAIARGVAWLKKRPDAKGWWGNETLGGVTYNGTTDAYLGPFGPTALAVYTLLKCGVPPNDPLVRRGFEYLRRSKSWKGHSYEISMTLLAVTATADPFKKTKNATAAGGRVNLVGANRTWAQELLEKLLTRRAGYAWRYWGAHEDTRGGPRDLSSTQLAALAMFSAERCGLKVDPKVWSGVIRYTLEQQEESGPPHPRAVHAPPARSTDREGGGAGGASIQDAARGFAYIRRSNDKEDRSASGGMTACGIANLMMARFSLTTRAPAAWRVEDAARIQQSIYDGLAWLDAHWSPYKNSGADPTSYDLYHVYCVERAMDLVGASRIGAHFWYAEMAKEVLSRQAASGCWPKRGENSPETVMDTCFALLFLHRATKGGIPFPVVTGGSEEAPQDGR
jgi:hypothetical protein